MEKKNKTKKATKKTNNKKKKGFTLVELLAVIIILAIVVGITIPAVLTTTNKTKAKALKTAAQSVANWVDRQYEVYTKGLDMYEVAKIDPAFKSLCIRKCGENGYTDIGGKPVDLGYNSEDNCSCDKRINYITEEFATAAGILPSNIRIGIYHTSSGGSRSQSVRIIGGYAYKTNSTADTSRVDWTQNLNVDYGYGYNSHVYINSETGKSCVTLVTSADGEYLPNTIACGGSCYTNSDGKNRADYCGPEQ